VEYVFATEGSLRGITYRELASRIGQLNKHGDPHPRLGKPLGVLGHLLEDVERSAGWTDSIPDIQSLAVNKSGKLRGLPDVGRKKGGGRKGSGAGVMSSLAAQAAPSKLPGCPYFYAPQEVFVHVSPDLGGDAIAQWCFHGDKLPFPPCRFWAFSMQRTDWIGSGGIYLEEGLTMASLDKGYHADFARYEKDAHGLVLVIFTHRMVQRS
jgi:hypothetical protein